MSQVPARSDLTVLITKNLALNKVAAVLAHVTRELISQELEVWFHRNKFP